MPSMFEKTARKLVKEIGDKELRPVKDILNANKIGQFSLIRRRKARSRFLELPDVPLDVTLMDILEGSAPVPDAAVEASGVYSYTKSWQQQAGASVNARAEAGVSWETTACQGSSLEYKIVSTPNETLTDLQKRKVKDPEPSVLEQCRRAEMNLYVVTDIVELRDSCVLEDRSTGNFLGKLSFILDTLVKVEGGGRALKVTEKKHVVPEGSVMAYKRKQLVFRKNSWEILHVSDDEKETFPEEIFQCRYILAGTNWSLSWGGLHVIEPIQRIQEPFWLDFKCLHEEVSREVNKVTHLSKDVKGVVFSSVRALLGDRGALQDLMDMLVQKPLGHLDGPGGTILNELRKDSSSAWKGLILYLLEAILALSDVQHCLLVASMEKKILSPQRDLVRSILEPNFKYPWSIPFTLKLELLAPLQGEQDLAITYGLLSECGLEMELDSPRSTWDLEAKKPLCALYGTLSVLQQLAEA